jgi:hypothetical protein
MRGWYSLIGWAMAAGLAAGCAVDTPRAELPDSLSLEFIDSATFDRKLSEALSAAQSSVIVTFLAPITTNALPERLDRWIYQIEQKYGNRLAVLPDPELPQERGVVGVALALATKAYQMVREEMLYGPARGYDAAVLYAPADGRITRVVFTRRPAEATQ